MATLEECLLALNGNIGPRWGAAEDSSIKPSYLVMQGTAIDQIKICATNGDPIGVADCDDDHDLNTVYTAGVSVPYWELGSGVDIMVLFDDGTNNTTITRVEKLIRDSTNAGAVKKWAYTDATEETDTMGDVVGRPLRQVVISGDTPTFIPIRLGL